MKLKIFSDRKYIIKGGSHDNIFSPFWKDTVAENLQNLDYPPNASWNGTFDSYTENGSSFIEMTSLQDADLAVLPTNCESSLSLEGQTLATQFIEQAEHLGKPVAGFFYGDCSHLELPFKCDLIFRNSLYRSSRNISDFAYPAWCVDFTEKYFDSQIPIRQKTTKPTIGFCGFAGKKDFKLYLKPLLYDFYKIFKSKENPPFYMGQVLRNKALSVLNKSSQVETNFILRESMGLFSKPVDEREEFRKVYVQNIAESDYILCCRGYGNYSWRFYETLSCGRIPVFIDTDCVLPYEFEIDWKKYCVWINENEIPMIAEKVAEFHASLSPQEFIDLQHECRKIWKEKLSPEGFYANLYRHLHLVK